MRNLLMRILSYMSNRIEDFDRSEFLFVRMCCMRNKLFLYIILYAANILPSVILFFA